MAGSRIINSIERLENKLGAIPAGAIVAFIFMILAALYVRPAIETKALGNLYARMASDPFTVIDGNYVAYRIFTPLISFLLGLRGQLYIITNNIMAALLVWAVYSYFRRKTDDIALALFAAAVVTFSQITLITVYLGGYPDSTTYLMIFLCWYFRRNIFLHSLFLLFCFLNRESVFFLLPWFVFLRLSDAGFNRRVVLGTVVGYAIIGSIVLVTRNIIAAHGKIPFDTAYYFSPLVEDPFHWVRRWYPEVGLAFFGILKAFWLVPIVAAIDAFRGRDRKFLVSVALILIGALAQMVIAFDSSRMLTLSFMIVIVSLLYLYRNHADLIKKYGFALVLINLIIPQTYIAAHTIEFMYSIPGILFHTFGLNRPIW